MLVMTKANSRLTEPDENQGPNCTYEMRVTYSVLVRSEKLMESLYPRISTYNTYLWTRRITQESILQTAYVFPKGLSIHQREPLDTLTARHDLVLITR
jgi:hypothetical protein